MRFCTHYMWVLMLLIPGFLAGQIQLKGKIIDKNSGRSVPFVQISAENEKWTSEKDGSFDIVIGNKKEIIVFDRIAYATESLSFTEMTFRDGIILIELSPSPVMLGEIIIEDAPEHSIPQSDEIIDEIKMVSQPMDAGDLLKGVAGFGVSKRGVYAQEPVFRSFRQEQINVLFDGFVQYHHACPNRMDPNVTHVIPAEIRKVEIIKGPFSVRYGPSMGATLNYLTESSDTRDPGFFGSVESGYEFNGQGKTARASLGYKAKMFDVYLDGSIKDYENYISGGDFEVPSSFLSKDYGLKVGLNPATDHRLVMNWNQSFLRDAQFAGLPMDARSDNSSLFSMNYRWTNVMPNLRSIEIQAFGNTVDHVMDNFDRKNFAAVEAESIVQADTYGAKSELEWMLGSSGFLFTGVDVKTLFRDGFRERLVKKNMKTGVDLPEPKFFTDKIWQDSRIMNTGLFTEYKWYPASEWTITTGLRVDMVHASIQDPAEDFAEMYDLDDRSELNLSANLAGALRINEHLSMQLALGRGVRSASIDERFINHFAVGKDPYELVGNPLLDPEVNHQVEYAIRYKLENLDLQFNTFYSRFSNLITAAVDTSLSRKYSPWLEPKFAKRFVNVPDAFQTGLEISADYRIFRYLVIHGQFAYTYAQNISWDEPISRIPPMEGVVKLSYQRAKWWAEFDGRFVAKQSRTAESFGEIETPGFNLYSTRLGLKPFKGMVLGLTVENIFDTDYVEFLNWSFNSLIGEGLVREPGRNISLYARYKF